MSIIIRNKSLKYRSYTRSCMTLGKIFDLSRSTISNYKNEMLQDEDYAQYVLDVGYNIVLIKITGFEEFLRTNNKKWFKSY